MMRVQLELGAGDLLVAAEQPHPSARPVAQREAFLVAADHHAGRGEADGQHVLVPGSSRAEPGLGQPLARGPGDVARPVRHGVLAAHPRLQRHIGRQALGRLGDRAGQLGERRLAEPGGLGAQVLDQDDAGLGAGPRDLRELQLGAGNGTDIRSPLFDFDFPAEVVLQFLAGKVKGFLGGREHNSLGHGGDITKRLEASITCAVPL